MNHVKQAYDLWARQYDVDVNKTRDLEAIALRELLQSIEFDTCLEIGCGTGKNTGYLASRAKQVKAVDLSTEMLAEARKKIRSENVHFVAGDINEDWAFADNEKFDLVTFSLVLEHIEDLGLVFHKLSNVIADDGYVYIGELHPFKQYTGSKARFDTLDGQHIPPCFTHHISDFTELATRHGFKIEALREYFDSDNKTIPRILALTFRKY